MCVCQRHLADQYTLHKGVGLDAFKTILWLCWEHIAKTDLLEYRCMSLCMYDAKALCRFSDVARINRTLKEILQCFLVTAIPIRFRFYCHTQQPLSLLFRDCLPEKHCFYDQTCFLRDDIRQHDTSCLIAKYILPVSQHDLKNRGQ